MKKLLLALILVLLASWPCQAQDQGGTISETLAKEHKKADANEQKVRELTQQAGKISTRISDIEQDVRVLQKKIGSQEAVLAEIRDNEKQTRKAHFELEEEKQRIALELSGLLQTLWPVHMQNVRARFQGVDSWDMFDRRFNWLAKIYETTNDKMEEARINSEQIAENLEKQRQLEEEAEKQLAQINQNKDKLLGDKYALRKNLKNIREERQSIEAELNDILSTIENLKYQLQSQKTKRFSLYKRTLPWPVKGNLKAEYNPNATPPVRGLAIGTDTGARVQSVFWGKVVHNDTLRGFGHVIIIYHGYDYYSLYAYLSETYVRTGQEVEKDEPLGLVGFYPKVDGPGLYFELRFHQKPINPKLWLTALN